MKSSVDITKILITMTEAAALCNCSYSTIQKIVKRKQLPTIKLGKTYLLPVDALINHVNLLITK